MRPWSRWLRWYRDQHDLTQEELGEVLGVEGKMVSAWENGQRPGRRHTRNICRTLRTTRAELGLVELEPEPLVARRDFLRRSVGWGAVAMFGPWPGADPIDPGTVAGFQVTTETLGRLCLRAGPGAVLGPALGHVESVGRLFRGSLLSSVRPQLSRVLAEGAMLLSVVDGWVGDHEGSHHFAKIALQAAQEADDPDLRARLLLMQTSGDRSLDPHPAVRLSRYTEVAARQGVESATRAWALARAADVHAALGRSEPAMDALDEAGRLLAGRPGTHFPWPDERWLSGERGASLARLGRIAEARQALDAAVTTPTEERGVDRLWLLLASARTHLTGGDRVQATSIALDVLRSARAMRHGQLEDETARLLHSEPSSSGQ
jgi:transcriptional regulator with XRE-family HTH domain